MSWPGNGFNNPPTSKAGLLKIEDQGPLHKARSRLRRIFTKVSNPGSTQDGLDPNLRGRMLGETSHSTEVSKMRSFWGLISAYWKSEDKYKAWMLGAAIAGLTCVDVALGVEMTKWPGEFIDTVFAKDSTSLDLGMEVLRFIGLGVGFASVWNYRYFLERKLIIGWRGWWTEQFGNAALSNKSFFHIINSKTVPNLDQRLAEDPDILASKIIELYTGGMRAGLGIMAYTYALYQLTGSVAVNVMNHTIAAPSPFFWASFGAAAGCAVAGTIMLRKYGKPSIFLNEHYIRAQGALRNNLTIMFSHASEIASYDGQTVERKNLRDDFNAVKQKWMGNETMQAKIGAMLGINNDMSKLVSWGMALMNYKVGHILTAGSMMKYADIFNALRHNMAWPMQISQDVFKIRSVANFMTNFAEQIEQSKDPQNFYAQHGKNANIVIKDHAESSIAIQDVKIRDSINDKPIITIPSLTIKKGERVLLAGQSGSGKSLLIRSIGGLWKHGDGDVVLPAEGSRMFVPQTAYIMGNMTLKENIIYPAYDWTEHDDESITEALNQAELGYLIPYLNDKDRNGTSWRDLSPGEKQRLIFARIFLHKPDIVFLDEATSALDAQLQNVMYRRLNEILPKATVVSIAHREELMKYHTRRIDIQDGGLVESERRTVLSYCQTPRPRPPFIDLRNCAA